MSPRLRFILAGSVLLVVLKFCVRVSAQTGDQLPAGTLFGEVTLTSNAIERGITQSDKSFALQTGLGYKWTQFRAGLWGSNVKYPDSDDTLNLRVFMDYRFVFTSNADMTARYDFNRYFSAGDRNGAIVGVDLRFFQSHVLYEQFDNWEGTGKTATRWGYMTDWKIPWDLVLGVNAGYNMLKASGLTNYFDVRTKLTYRWADLDLSLGHSYASNSGQFEGRGDMFFFFSAAAKF